MNIEVLRAFMKKKYDDEEEEEEDNYYSTTRYQDEDNDGKVEKVIIKSESIFDCDESEWEVSEDNQAPEFCEATIQSTIVNDSAGETNDELWHISADDYSNTVVDRSELISASRDNCNEFKPYSCNICAKPFSRKATVNTHMLTHNTSYERYKCKICHKVFNYEKYLRRHEKIHNGIKRYKCNLCEKAFHQKCNLDNHILTHSKERPFKCSICPNEFKTKILLASHLLTHRNCMYKCDICKKKFRRESQLRMHLSIRIDGKTHKCDVCEKEFTYVCEIKIHCLLVHRITYKRHPLDMTKR